MLSKIVASMVLVSVVSGGLMPPPVVRYTQPVVATVNNLNNNPQFYNQLQQQQPHAAPIPPLRNNYPSPIPNQQIQSVRPTYGQPQPNFPVSPNHVAPNLLPAAPVAKVPVVATAPIAKAVVPVATPVVGAVAAPPSNLLGVVYSPVHPGTASLHFKGFGTSYTLF